MSLLTNFNLLKSGNIERQYYILLRQNLLALCTEVVEAEVCRCVHAIISIVTAGQLKTNLGNFTKAREINIAPVIYDVRLLGIAQIGQIELLGAGFLIIFIVACNGELEPVTLLELLGKAVTTGHGAICIAAVGDVEPGNNYRIIRQFDIAGTVEWSGKGYTIVGRSVITTADNVVPLVIK